MRLHTLRVVSVVALLILVALAVLGCSSSGTSSGNLNNDGGSNNNGTMNGGGSGSGPNGGTNGMMNGGGSNTNNDSSVGQRVYLTGAGTDGQAIPRTVPRVSPGSLMMGGGGCGSCHAADGRGGTITMMTGTAITAPDVTYGALVKEGFTDTTIRKAITDGLDESGKQLDAAMPRWHMSGADLDATIAYLKELNGR